MALGWLALLVAGLASYRAARLVALDSLFEGTRDRVEAWGERPALRRDGTVRVGPTLARAKFATLATCGFCSGAWLALATYAALVTALHAWHAAPWYGHLVGWFAVAGIEALLFRWDATR